MGRSTSFISGMKVLHICMVVSAEASGAGSADDFETEYQNLFKKCISFLYAHPEYKLTFSFAGQYFAWLFKKHPEFITLLKELLARKQIELLGGGFYNPVFPLLLPMDRIGQIELYNTELSGAVGKRPRGMTVYGSVWDNTMVSSLANSGMEYVLLDSSLVPPEKRLALPLLVTEQGKSVTVLPVSRDCTPDGKQDAATYLAALKKQVAKRCKGNAAVQSDNRIVCIRLESARCKQLLESGWLESLFQAVQGAPGDMVLTTPQAFRKQCTTVVPAYLAPGISSDVAQWGRVAYAPTENKSSYPVTIYDFLALYRRNQALYNRVLYVSTLIANCHGDKIRKKQAREKLWQAQTGEAFVCNPEGIFATNAIRQNAYRALTEAEKIVRECMPKGKSFKESVTSYDYNADGNDEYICQMQSFDACISRVGASITELDIMHNTGNYADNLRRIATFDKVSDNYERGLFVEHLFSKEECKDYKKGLPTGSGIFSRVLFTQTAFDKKRNEIKLLGTGEFGALRQPVSLRKHYIINANGFTVQYILKNDSPIALKAQLLVESNFAQTDFSCADCNSYHVEAISKGEGQTIPAGKSPTSLGAVSYLQITDTSHDISFVYEPNEDADITCMPLFFRRPRGEGSVQLAGTTFVASLCWSVDLPAGGEMEKNINFTIITPKKRKSKKK